MQLPSIIGSVINLLLGLASIAGLGSLILAGWSLRQEAAGANFQVGGSFLKYVLWAGIFLTLPGVFSWLNANGVSVQQETTGAPSGYMQQIETVIETFVTDIVLDHLVPVLAAVLVLKGVLDASEGHVPVGSIVACLFLLGVYGVYNHARQQWNDVSAYATTNFLMNAWTYVATSICPIAAGLAIAGGILAYVRNQQWAHYVGCALALLSVTGLYALVKTMTGVTS